MMKNQGRVLSKKVLLFSLVFTLTMVLSGPGFADVTINGYTFEDDFNDNDLNTNQWTSFGDEPSRYATEINNRLEIRADGTQNDSAGVSLSAFISVNQDFRVQVDFNALDCTENSVIGLMVYNTSTDIHHFDEWIAICNGQVSEGGVLSRSWCAFKAINDSPVESEIKPTTSTSGTFYIEHKGSTFYVSFTGYGAENAFASFAIDDWTSCNEVMIGLFAWSGNKVLSGQGSYFDNCI